MGKLLPTMCVCLGVDTIVCSMIHQWNDNGNENVVNTDESYGTTRRVSRCTVHVDVDVITMGGGMWSNLVNLVFNTEQN